MTQKSTEIRELTRRIKAREEFLDNVTEVVANLVRKHGTVTKRDQQNNHINVVTELRNFGSFTFETDFGQTDFGGNTVRVWYHPKQDFLEGRLDSTYDNTWIPDLDVYFQTDYTYKVRHFSEGSSWKKALARVLKNQDKIVERIKKTQDEAKTKLAGWREEDKEMAKLSEVAKRLGIKTW